MISKSLNFIFSVTVRPREASAASDSRRDDVIESRATSATTAPRPP